MNKFDNILQKLASNMFDYWNKMGYEHMIHNNFINIKKNGDYILTLSNNKYTITISWYENTCALGKTTKKYILEMGEYTIGRLVMINVLTGVFGEHFENDTDLISYVFKELKRDKDFIKYLRKDKLYRIINEKSQC